MEVIATDSKGNTFVKKVTTVNYGKGLIINFGGPCEYYLKDLMVHYPYKKPLCIDMGGRNHLGNPEVSIAAIDMNRILQPYKQKSFWTRCKDSLFYISRGPSWGYGPRWWCIRNSWKWSGEK